MDWFVNVRVPVLDDHHWVEPFVETYTTEKLAWASTPATHSFKAGSRTVVLRSARQ